MKREKVSNIKNKTFLFLVLRKDIDVRDFPAVTKDVVCAITKTPEAAEALAARYQQEFEDRGGNRRDSYYYISSNIYYDE